MPTSYPSKYVEICLTAYDFIKNKETEITDYVFYIKPGSEPVMVRKDDHLNYDHIIEIAHQASIPFQRFESDLKLVQRLWDQRNDDTI